MNTAAHYYHRGMGSGADTAVQLSTTAAGGIVPVVVGPSVATLLGISTTLAMPIVGVAIAGISIAIEAILHSGCGQTCIVTSQWANQAEGYLKQNIQQYFAIVPPRPQSVQQLAMGNFKAIWNTLVQQCGQPGLGTAGQNCINDRKDGACKWKALPPSYPGEPAAGACWNWWNGYYYPIANDPNVVPDASLVTSTVGSTVSSVASTVSSAATSLLSNPILLLGVGLIGIAILTQL